MRIEPLVRSHYLTICLGVFLVKLIQLDAKLTTARAKLQQFRFSGKSPYYFVDKPLVRPSGCRPVQINMLLRHGSRYPSRTSMKRTKILLKQLNKLYRNTSGLTYKKLELPWRMPEDFQSSASKEMCDQGEREMYWIAKRYAAKLPEILSYSYSNNNYSFVATDKLRTAQSLVAFAHGLFEGKGSLGLSRYQPVALKMSGLHDNDKVLRYYNACPRFKRIKKSNGENGKFMRGPEVKRTVQNIERRLNLTGKFKMSASNTYTLWLLCAFETQVRGKASSWCSIFDREDLKVFEYFNDLRLYYDYGYGNRFNQKITCHLMSDMTSSMREFVSGKGKPHGTFRFAHSAAVIGLLSTLGLFRDSVHLRADNYRAQANRKFMLSDLVPMSGNVAFVLYECDDSKTAEKANQTGTLDPQKKSNYKIQVLVNEVAAPLPCCSGESACGLARFQSCFRKLISKCDFDTLCDIPRRRKGKGRRKGKKNGKRKNKNNKHDYEGDY